MGSVDRLSAEKSAAVVQPPSLYYVPCSQEGRMETHGTADSACENQNYAASRLASIGKRYLLVFPAHCHNTLDTVCGEYAHCLRYGRKGISHAQHPKFSHFDTSRTTHNTFSFALLTSTFFLIVSAESPRRQNILYAQTQLSLSLPSTICPTFRPLPP